jgi:hypothetical protein
LTRGEAEFAQGTYLRLHQKLSDAPPLLNNNTLLEAKKPAFYTL